MLFLYGIAAGPLYRTEALRAVIGAEAARGHWLYPVLYGEPFLTKPPGHYAAIGLCSLPFGGVTAWSARLPSVVAATAAVFLMYGLFRRTFGERAGVLAAVLVPTSVLWLDKAPSAEIDMTLVGWVTAALVLLHRAVEAEETRRAGGVNPLSACAAADRMRIRGADAPRSPVVYWVGALLCVAAGTLTKWTAPAFFYLTAVPLLAWRGRLRLLFGWRHLLAVGVAAGVCAAWAAAVAHQVGWDALVGTIRSEVAYRFNPPPKAKGYPWGEVVTYPLLVLAAHLPLSAFALRTLRPSFFRRWDDRGRLLLQFLHCWTWPSLLFWALVPNHNVRYALPLSPGLMGLGVMGLIGWWKSRSRDAESAERSAPAGGRAPLRRPSASRLRGALLAFLACWAVVKVVFVEVVVPQRSANRDAASAAAHLNTHVPARETLYVFRLKDEGVTFAYGRPVRRLRDPRDLPPGAVALLIRPEWEGRAAFADPELICCMSDQQGDPLYLVKARPHVRRPED